MSDFMIKTLIVNRDKLDLENPSYYG